MDLLEARVPNPSAAQRCHTDALHCVFGWLSVADWLPELLSCRVWLTVTHELGPDWTSS